MKNFKHNIKLFAAAAAVGALATGCSMDLIPLNEVVLENYWTNKEDVDKCVNSCYAGLQEGSLINSLIIWGEVRSDNVDEGDGIPASLQDVLNGGLKTTNPYCNWGAFYNVINRCNIVLHYAPQVAFDKKKHDPNYTESDYQVTVAEMKTLRAWSYLTLAKTFQNVPFTLEASIDDTQDYRLAATPFEKIIDSLIIDLEPVKDYAPKKLLYKDGQTANIQSTGRITRPAVYALLAELYLWKASDANRDRATQMEAYKKCVEMCDWVLKFKIDQKEREDFPEGSRCMDHAFSYEEDFDPKVYEAYGIPLLREGGTAQTTGRASEYLFERGNCFESLFEISYMNTSSDQYIKNEDIINIYGGMTKDNKNVSPKVKGNNILCSESLDTKKEYSDAKPFSVFTDYRSYIPFEWADGGTFYINKYVQDVSRNSYARLESKWAPATAATSTRSYLSWASSTYNWIVYRLSDVILMRAEAEIELAGIINKMAAENAADDDDKEGDDDAPVRARKVLVEGKTLSTAEEYYADAYNLIRAVYDRSNPDAVLLGTESAIPQLKNYTTHEQFEQLLLNERRREFLFEGKRYYDIVRQARREGNTQKFSEAMMKKFGGTSAAIRVKMTMMDFMYLPYAKSQIKVNPNLVQNPAFEDEEETVKN